MLTRLRVTGFKNLVDVDVRFGPFTCIAGANGAGKSNLLDAILFLSRLADSTLQDAALAVRNLKDMGAEIRDLFHRCSGDQSAEKMSFVAEMIIPATGSDDLGQPATASSTFVEYSVALHRGPGGLEISTEELRAISTSEAGRQFISTERDGDGGDVFLRIHADSGGSGKPQPILARSLPRTVLSRANSAESPTATIVRKELQSWRLLQLEPAALRQPDGLHAPFELSTNGAHLPATLFRLAHAGGDPSRIYASVSNGLSQLLEDVRTVFVDRDEGRQLLTLYARGRDGTAYPARSLSDGTLRFLAMEVLAADEEAQGLLCVEEPENGIQPGRIPALIRLLRQMAGDPESDEPGARRQVIITTHSPAVVMQVPDDSLLLADSVTGREGSRTLRLRGLANTWRKDTSIAKGQLLSYLNPVERREPSSEHRRVADREDLIRYRMAMDEADR